jgi:hypothetical protein
LIILRHVAYVGQLNILDCTRSERAVVWSLAERGLLTSQAGFYTVTDRGRDELAAAGANPAAGTRGGAR